MYHATGSAVGVKGVKAMISMGKSTEYKVFSTTAGEKIYFPVATVTGAYPGPCLAVTAGIHGCEYPGIAAAIALFQELNPDQIHGTVRITPIVSVDAFEKRSPFVSPADGKNPNRFFPGNPEGTFTEVLTYHYLKDLLQGADYHLDLHGGDMVEALEPFALCHEGADPNIDQKSFELACFYGLPNLVKTTWDGPWPDRGTTYANAAVNGIPSVIVEAGGIGQMDPDSVGLHLKGLRNVLRYLGILEGQPDKTFVQVYPEFRWVYTPWKGIFFRHVSVGDMVAIGQNVGEMRDYFGNVLGEILSPVEGKVVFLTTCPAMAEQGLLMGIACGQAQEAGE